MKIRELLSQIGDINDIQIDHPGVLDLEVVKTYWGASCGDGGLRYHCGGEVVVAITPDTISKRQVVLVVDSSEYDRWHFEMREYAAKNGGSSYGYVADAGPCPVKKLCLRQTA